MSEDFIDDPLSIYDNYTFDGGITPPYVSIDKSPAGHTYTPGAKAGKGDADIIAFREWAKNQPQPVSPMNQISSTTMQNDPSLFRTDGSRKGPGFLGPLKMTDGTGRDATEISVGVNINGKEVEIPTLIGTLTNEERNYLLSGGKPTSEIINKAVEHAKQRMSEGKSLFKEGTFDGTGMPTLTGEDQGGSPFPNLFNKPIIGSPLTPGGKNTVFGVPADDLSRTLGTIAAGFAPRSAGGRVGQGMADLVTREKSEEMQNKRLGIQERHLGVQESTLAARLGIQSEKGQLALSKLAESEKQRQAEVDAIGKLFEAQPGLPEAKKAAIDYLKTRKNLDNVPEQIWEALGYKKAGTEKGDSYSIAKRMIEEQRKTLNDPTPVAEAEIQKQMETNAGNMTKSKADQSVTGQLNKKALMDSISVDKAAEDLYRGAITYDQFMAEQRMFGPIGSINRKAVRERMDEIHPDFSSRLAQFENKANQSALTDLTKREALIGTFVTRIDKTSDEVLIPLMKKYDLQNPKFLNIPVTKLSQLMGSGDYASLKLALNSISQEVGKVEFNSLGIQQLTDAASKIMNTIHDPTMPVDELIKVIQTGKDLGRTAMESIKDQRTELKGSTFKDYGRIPPQKEDYKPLINESAKKYGLDPSLIDAIIQHESSKNPKAVSPKGAQGLMQLMPGTAKQYGVTDPFDPKQNIEGGTRYLSDLMKKYKGNSTLALIEYNGGKLPKETLNYVQKIVKPGEVQVNKDKTKIKVQGQVYGVE